MVLLRRISPILRRARGKKSHFFYVLAAKPSTPPRALVGLVIVIPPPCQADLFKAQPRKKRKRKSGERVGRTVKKIDWNRGMVPRRSRVGNGIVYCTVPEREIFWQMFSGLSFERRFGGGAQKWGHLHMAHKVIFGIFGAFFASRLLWCLELRDDSIIHPNIYPTKNEQSSDTERYINQLWQQKGGEEKKAPPPPPIRTHTKRMKYTTHLKIDAAADMCEFVVSKSRDFGSTFDFPNTKRKGDTSKRDF